MRTRLVCCKLLILMLILLVSLPLTSCGVISAVGDLLDKPSPATTVALATQRPAETSSLPILERELSKNPHSLISDRLLIQMPVGAEDIARQQDIMSAPRSSQGETRLVLEGNGQQLVLYAQETFYTTDDLEKNIDTILKLRYGKDFAYTTQAVKQSGNGLKVLCFSPNNIDTTTNAVLIRGAVVGIDDGTFISVGVYVTPETAEEEELCLKQAERILNSIQPGSRRISGLAQEERLGQNSLTIQLDKGYVIVQDEGVDFSVFYLMKYVKLGEPAPSVGIYIGEYPSWVYQQRGIQESQLTKTKDTILRRGVEWLSYKSNEEQYSAETYLYLNERLIMHIFVDAADEAEFDAIKEMIHTLKIK